MRFSGQRSLVGLASAAAAELAMPISVAGCAARPTRCRRASDLRRRDSKFEGDRGNSPGTEICFRTTDENRMTAMKHSPRTDLVAVLRGAPVEGLSAALAFLFP